MIEVQIMASAIHNQKQQQLMQLGPYKQVFGHLGQWEFKPTRNRHHQDSCLLCSWSSPMFESHGWWSEITRSNSSAWTIFRSKGLDTGPQGNMSHAIGVADKIEGCFLPIISETLVEDQLNLDFTGLSLRPSSNWFRLPVVGRVDDSPPILPAPVGWDLPTSDKMFVGSFCCNLRRFLRISHRNSTKDTTGWGAMENQILEQGDQRWNSLKQPLKMRSPCSTAFFKSKWGICGMHKKADQTTGLQLLNTVPV